MALATNIHVVFDSRYGHIDTMAEAVAAGSGQAGNIEVTPVRVAELVPHEVLEESGAKAARAALPRASGQVRAVGGRRGHHLEALMAITASLNDDKNSNHLGGVFRSEVVEFGDMPTQPQEEMVMEDSHKHSINNAGQSASVGLIIRPKEPTNLETPFAQLDAFLTPTELFYIGSHFPTPQVELASYHLRIDGAVRHPCALSYQALRDLPSETQVTTLECAGNSRVFLIPQVAGAQWEVGAVGKAAWTGVPLAALLERSGMEEDACEIVLEGADQGTPHEAPVPPGPISYVRGVPRDKAMQREVLSAYQMNGRDLPQAHGYPVRSIVPGQYGMAAVKWLTRMHAVREPFHGYWQTSDCAYWAYLDGKPVRRGMGGRDRGH